MRLSVKPCVRLLIGLYPQPNPDPNSKPINLSNVMSVCVCVCFFVAHLQFFVHEQQPLSELFDSMSDCDMCLAIFQARPASQGLKAWGNIVSSAKNTDVSCSLIYVVTRQPSYANPPPPPQRCIVVVHRYGCHSDSVRMPYSHISGFDISATGPVCLSYIM